MNRLGRFFGLEFVGLAGLSSKRASIFCVLVQADVHLTGKPFGQVFRSDKKCVWFRGIDAGRCLFFVRLNTSISFKLSDKIYDRKLRLWDKRKAKDGVLRLWSACRRKASAFCLHESVVFAGAKGWAC